MQDPIRQQAVWNHQHRPPPILLPWCIFISLHFLLLNIKNRFLHVYVCAGDGIDGGGGKRRAQGGCCWWVNGGLEMTSGLTECLSITTHSLGYRWSLIFPTGAYLPAFIWQPGLTNLHVRQTTNGPVHVKIGGGAWQFLHNAVSFWLDPRPRAMSPFIIRERGRWGEEIIQPSFLSPATASLE